MAVKGCFDELSKKMNHKHVEYIFLTVLEI